MAYKRILLKLSGESLGHPETGHGIDPDSVNRVARQVVAVANTGVKTAVVVGGGNILRGAQFSQIGANRASADTMGMLGTLINALALSEAVEREGGESRVLSALDVHTVAEPFIRRRALAHLESGRIVILAAGTGNPYFTTDTAAALRATELGCDVLLKATKVDGVYTADPKVDPTATRILNLTYMEVLQKGLSVMDGTAITLCMEHKLPVVVFDMFCEGNIERVVRGESLGTTIRSHE